MAGYKPLCFLKHQETQPRQRTAETNTHGEDFLRLPTRSHVGVVDLFEDHPGFIMLPHLTGGKAGEKKEDEINSWDQQQSHLLRDSNSPTSKIIYTVQKSFDFSEMGKNDESHDTATHFTSRGNYPATANLLSRISRLPFCRHV